MIEFFSQLFARGKESTRREVQNFVNDFLYEVQDALSESSVFLRISREAVWSAP